MVEEEYCPEDFECEDNDDSPDYCYYNENYRNGEKNFKSRRKKSKCTTTTANNDKNLNDCTSNNNNNMAKMNNGCDHNNGDNLIKIESNNNNNDADDNDDKKNGKFLGDKMLVVFIDFFPGPMKTESTTTMNNGNNQNNKLITYDLDNFHLNEVCIFCL